MVSEAFPFVLEVEMGIERNMGLGGDCVVDDEGAALADVLQEEIEVLEARIAEVTRNFSLDVLREVQTGTPREGASQNEQVARECYRRLAEIRAQF